MSPHEVISVEYLPIFIMNARNVHNGCYLYVYLELFFYESSMQLVIRFVKLALDWLQSIKQFFLNVSYTCS